MVLLVVTGFLLLPAAGAAGQLAGVEPRAATTGPNFRISYSPGHDRTAAVAHNSTANQYLVVWEDGRSYASTGSNDIFGQLVAADGTRIGANFRIAGRTTDDQAPAVVFNPDANEYFVVWSNGRNWATTGYDIYGRRIAADGTLLGTGIRITSDPGTDAADSTPAVAYNGATHQYLVVWAYERDWEWVGVFIHGQLVNADGSLQGADFLVGAWDTGWYENSPAVAYDSVANQYLVAWQARDESAPYGCYQVWGHALKAGGTAVGPAFPITNTATGFCTSNPAVAAMPAGGYVVVWEDERPTVTGRGVDIRARQLAADGTPAGSSYRISGRNAVGSEYHPRLAHNATANTYVVVWADTRNPTRGVDIFGKRLTDKARPTGPDFRISGLAATTDEAEPEVVYGASAGQYLVVFATDRFSSTRGWDAFGQRLKG
ncbi:MAG: hypothetical protein JW785_12035 [Acidimicrobiia bacterium]|nr:hypothetical protein [Acidimicrobiia bacterium]